MSMEPGDHVRFRVPPPVIYGLPSAVGVIVDLVVPLPVLPHGPALALGAAALAAAVAVLGWAVRTMFAAGEHPDPGQPTGAIVSGGPYRFSRNPLYVALTLFAAGVALAVNSGWGLALLVPSIVATHYWAIAPEERYLEGRLGEQYRAYRARVRRWL